jgi:hypothetical protein
MHFLKNVCPEMKVVAHLHLFPQYQVGHVMLKQKQEVTPEVSRRWRFRVGGHPYTKGQKKAKEPDRRSTRWMMWQGRHVSHPCSHDTEIFVNLK